MPAVVVAALLAVAAGTALKQICPTDAYAWTPKRARVGTPWNYFALATAKKAAGAGWHQLRVSGSY